MTIIIPKDYKDLIYLSKELKRLYPEITIILSPFMYMNYEDALTKTHKLLKEFYLDKFLILDLTGITSDIYYMVFGVEKMIAVYYHIKEKNEFIKVPMRINLVFDK